MFIGRPSGTCTVSVTSVKIRLPDKYFGMFLAYSQDQYGISPHALSQRPCLPFPKSRHWSHWSHYHHPCHFPSRAVRWDS